MQDANSNIKKSIVLKAVKENFQACMEFVESLLKDAGVEYETIMTILTACEEVIINIIDYAYPAERGNLKIEFEKKENTIILFFTDSGIMFNPLMKKEADISLTLEEREAGGLGILMVTKLMDEVKYEYKENRNTLRIVKKINDK